MSAIDGIRKRAEAYKTHGTPGLAAPKDRAVLLAAVDAMAAVHKPAPAVMYSGSRQHIVQVCTGCGQDDGNWQRYPCPTATALSTALEVSA